MNTKVLTLLEIRACPQCDFDYAVKLWMDEHGEITSWDHLSLAHKAVHHVDPAPGQPIAYAMSDLGKGAEVAKRKIEQSIKTYQSAQDSTGAV